MATPLDVTEDKNIPSGPATPSSPLVPPSFPDVSENKNEEKHPPPPPFAPSPSFASPSSSGGGREEVVGPSMGELRHCALCLEDVESGYCLQSCGHFSCRECLSTYLRSCLKDQSAYPLLCYHRPECKQPLAYTDVINHLTPEEVAIYDKFSIRAAFKETSTTCPRSGCNALMILESADFAQAVTCSTCGFVFCPRCQVAWHRDKTCAEFLASRGNAAEEKENVLKLQALADKERWFSCPTCKMLIERTGGCNHLTHFAKAGCSIQGAEATHFCSLCAKVLGGAHHKTEQDTGLEHFPNGLFEKCRTVLEKEAGGAKKLAKLRKKQERAANREDPMRKWQNGLFSCGCSSDCRVACCCPCFMGAANAVVVSGGSKKWPCLGYCCCCCVYGPYRRYQIRHMFGIRSCCPCDCLVFQCCPCLAILQEHREFESRANLPATMFMA